MSGPGTDAGAGLHPLVERASRGELPPWAEVSPERREHLERVAALIDRWARARDEPDVEVARWRAAGYLHDALRDADPEALRGRVDEADRDVPAPLLHGPAAAARLREEGVRDGSFLRAVARHTMGDAEFDDLGRALYCADFLEPGRTFRTEWRATLRERMPEAMDDVLTEIVRARIVHLLEEGRGVRPETIELWNALAGPGPAGPGGGEWAPGSSG